MKRKKKLKHKSVKTVEKFCWNCSLPRRQPKLSCHVSELIGPSGVKTAACVQFVKRHVNTPVQIQMNGTEEQTGFKTASLTPPKLNEDERQQLLMKSLTDPDSNDQMRNRLRRRIVEDESYAPTSDGSDNLMWVNLIGCQGL